MKILVTGANGMLAHDLLAHLKKESWTVYPFAKQALNVAHPEAVQRQISQVVPDILINCAAYTKVDQAEKEEQAAYTINGQAVDNLSRVCKQHSIKLVHISTDFVFDGQKTLPYLEHDSPNPQCVYGRTKLQGEQVIQKNISDALIVRTSWLYGVRGNNFVKTMIRLAKERSELKVVDDQIGSPTWTGDLSEALILLIKAQASGMYHFSNQGQCSWYDFAKTILDHAYHQKLITVLPEILPIPTADYPLPAKRPAFSVLNCEKYTKAIKQPPPIWKESLSKMLIQLSQN